MSSFTTALNHFITSSLFATIGLLEAQRWRPVWSMLMVIFGLASFVQLGEATGDLGQNSVLGLFVLIWLVYMLNVLLVEQYTLPETTRLSRLRLAYKMLFNARWIGTSMPSPDILLCNPDHKTQKETRRSRLAWSMHPVLSIVGEKAFRRLTFVLSRLSYALIIYTINHLYEHNIIINPNPRIFSPLHLADFHPQNDAYFRRLLSHSPPTPRETSIRIWLVAHFLWTAWATFTFLHNVFAALFVALTLDEPSDWPPLYGSLREAYTLQGFWSRFWHRLVYRTYTSYAHWICTYILRIRPRSAIGQAIVGAFVFLASGFVHALVYRQLGVCRSSLEIWWFLMNFVAVVVEKMLLSAVARVRLRRMMPELVSRLIGHVWVFIFLFWSLPKAQYPKVHCYTETM